MYGDWGGGSLSLKRYERGTRVRPHVMTTRTPSGRTGPSAIGRSRGRSNRPSKPRPLRAVPMRDRSHPAKPPVLGGHSVGATVWSDAGRACACIANPTAVALFWQLSKVRRINATDQPGRDQGSCGPELAQPRMQSYAGPVTPAWQLKSPMADSTAGRYRHGVRIEACRSSRHRARHVDLIGSAARKVRGIAAARPDPAGRSRERAAVEGIKPLADRRPITCHRARRRPAHAGIADGDPRNYARRHSHAARNRRFGRPRRAHQVYGGGGLGVTVTLLVTAVVPAPPSHVRFTVVDPDVGTVTDTLPLATSDVLVYAPSVDVTAHETTFAVVQPTVSIEPGSDEPAVMLNVLIAGGETTLIVSVFEYIVVPSVQDPVPTYCGLAVTVTLSPPPLPGNEALSAWL